MTEDALEIIIGVTLWHLAMLNSLGLISGQFKEGWGIAPKRIIFSRPHLLGILAAIFGAVIIIASMALSLLNYGIFLGGGLILLDAYLTYRAFRPDRNGKRE